MSDLKVGSKLEQLLHSKSLVFSQQDIRLIVSPEIEGPLAFAVTAPRLVASRLQVQFESNPSAQVRAMIDANSFEVIPEKFSESDRKKIHSAVTEKILKADQYPFIEFNSTLVSIRTECHPFSLVMIGNLVLNGVTREVDLVFKHVGNTLQSSLKLIQSNFKIVPLKGFAGALRCKDAIEISLVVSLENAN